MCKDDLLPYLTPGPERGGVVLQNGTIIELKNCADEPDLGFTPDPTELLMHVCSAAATWHTHPNETANLSIEDAETFVAWSNLEHYIVGTDGVRCYRVKNGAVINA